jgi:hypothetical protein
MLIARACMEQAEQVRPRRCAPCHRLSSMTWLSYPTLVPYGSRGASGPARAQAVSAAEADSYWCLCKLLDGIQDHYTHAQPGIQRTVFRLKELVRRGAGGASLRMRRGAMG